MASHPQQGSSGSLPLCSQGSKNSKRSSPNGQVPFTCLSVSHWLMSTGQSKSRGQPPLKAWGNRLCLWVGGFVLSHCKGMDAENGMVCGRFTICQHKALSPLPPSTCLLHEQAGSSLSLGTQVWLEGGLFPSTALCPPLPPVCSRAFSHLLAF